MQLRMVIVLIALVVVSLFTITVLLHWLIKAAIIKKRERATDCFQISLQNKDRLLSKLGEYSHQAVASDVQECSTLGKEILDKGGSAVDASIVTTLCCSLYNPHGSGIGGGHISLIYKKEKNQMFVVDAREIAPIASTPEMFHSGNQSIPLPAGLKVAVPGEIYGYWMAHKLGGKLTWKELFSPIIDLCKNGIKIKKYFARILAMQKTCIQNDVNLKETFINQETNKTFEENEILKYSKLARTFEIISETNIEEFYKGNLAKKIVQEVNANGGIFTFDDLKNYTAHIKAPIIVNLNEDLKLFTAPPPASGLLTTMIIKLLTKFDINEDSVDTIEKQVLFHHRFIEASKFAFAHRSQLGDENFYDMKPIIENLLSRNYLSKIVSKINDNHTHDSSYYEPHDDFVDEFGTSHLSVLASNGDAVSITSSINYLFGACFSGSETGIIYNNHMLDFSSPHNTLVPTIDKKNFIQPKKRPISSMSPIIVLDANNGNVKLVIGASGGARIVSNLASIVIDNIFLNKNIKDAISDIQIHHQIKPDTVQVESIYQIPEYLRNGLEQKGHKLSCNTYGLMSTAQGIEVKNGAILAYSDGRKGGNTDGV